MQQDMSQARTAEERALAIAQQIADLMTEMNGLGFASAATGRIAGPGVEIRSTAGRWTAEAAR